MEAEAWAARLQAAEDFKNDQIKKVFTKAVPGWLRSKHMEQPSNTPVQDLFTFARQKMTIREMCRKEDYPEDGFNEINSNVSENVMNVLEILSTNQEVHGRQLKVTDEKIQSSQNPTRSQTATTDDQLINTQLADPTL